MASIFDIIIFFFFAGIIMLGSIWYLLRGLKKDKAPEIDKNEIYKRQLSELKQSLDNNQIETAEYENARLEIGRRMARNSREDIKISTPMKTRSALFLLIFMGVAVIGTYFFLGSPDLRDRPFSARQKELLARDPETLSTGEILLILQQKAKEAPQEATPHLLLGKVLAGEGRDDEALRAFQAALKRDNKDPETLAELGGVLFRMSGNKENPDSDAAIKTALAIDKNNLTALYYRGFFKWESGNKAEAMNLWQDGWARFEPKDQKRIALTARVIEQISKIEKGPNLEGSAPFLEAMQQAQKNGGNPQDFINMMVQNRINSMNENPRDVGLRLSVMRVLASAGKFDEARKVYQDGLNIVGNNEFEREILNVSQMMLQMPNNEKPTNDAQINNGGEK